MSKDILEVLKESLTQDGAFYPFEVADDVIHEISSLRRKVAELEDCNARSAERIGWLNGKLDWANKDNEWLRGQIVEARKRNE